MKAKTLSDSNPTEPVVFKQRMDHNQAINHGRLNNQDKTLREDHSEWPRSIHSAPINTLCSKSEKDVEVTSCLFTYRMTKREAIISNM